MTDAQQAPGAEEPDAYALRFRDRRVVLNRPVLTVGRHTDCDILLDSGLVSRRHARFRVALAEHGRREVHVEDLGSRNGILVNGARIQSPVLLELGDNISIGGEEAVLIEALASDQGDSTQGRLRQAMTLTELQPQAGPFQPGRESERTGTPSYATDVPGAPEASSDAGSREFVAGSEDTETRAASALSLLEPLFDKALRLKRPEDAERYVGRQLQAVRDSLRLGRSVSDDLARQASSFAVRLADAQGKGQEEAAGRWATMTVEIHHLRGEVMPQASVDRLYTVLRRARGFDARLLREYVTMLSAHAQDMAPSERFRLKRLSGLVQIASL